MLLPAFNNPSICELHFCANKSADSQDHSLPDGEIRYFTEYGGESGTLYGTLIIESYPEPKSVHFHADFGRESPRPDSRFRKVDADIFKAACQRVLGMTFHVLVGAKFSVGFESLPRFGIIRTLYGTSTEACGSEMFLNGATMTVHDDTFHELKWRVEDETENVSGELEGVTEIEADEEYFSALEAIVDTGLECLVYEFESSIDESESSEDANDTKDELRTKQG
jgi:hypothetical protein